MTLMSLRALTWGTVTGAVLSALLLAAIEGGWPDLARQRPGDSARQPPLPSEPSNAVGQRNSPGHAVPTGGPAQRDDRRTR